MRRCCADFPAATLDYDADSDSIDEFSSGDEAPMDFLDFDETEPEDPVRGADVGEETGETDEEGDDLEEGEDAPIASSSGQGPIIEIAGRPSW